MSDTPRVLDKMGAGSVVELGSLAAHAGIRSMRPEYESLTKLPSADSALFTCPRLIGQRSNIQLFARSLDSSDASCIWTDPWSQGCRTKAMTQPQPMIAIVDDDESVCRAVKRLVRSIGMKANSFTSGLAPFPAVCRKF